MYRRRAGGRAHLDTMPPRTSPGISTTSLSESPSPHSSFARSRSFFCFKSGMLYLLDFPALTFTRTHTHTLAFLLQDKRLFKELSAAGKMGGTEQLSESPSTWDGGRYVTVHAGTRYIYSVHRVLEFYRRAPPACRSRRPSTARQCLLGRYGKSPDALTDVPSKC